MQTLLVCTIPGALSNEQHVPSWERGTAWFSGPSSPALSSHCPHNSRESVCPSWRLRRGWAMGWCPRTWGRTRTREPGCVTAKFVANHFFATSMLRVFHQSWRHSPCSPLHRPTENRVSICYSPSLFSNPQTKACTIPVSKAFEYQGPWFVCRGRGSQSHEEGQEQSQTQRQQFLPRKHNENMIGEPKEDLEELKSVSVLTSPCWATTWVNCW